MKTELPPIGQYTLQQRLNREGSGEVWRAYDTGARRTTLIKFFRTDSSDAPASLLDNYVHTVERVATLHHPHIAPIYDVHILPSQGPNKSGSLICLATKYVEGSNLADYIHTMSATGKLPPPGDVISIFTSIAQALEVAYHHGIVHGNLKPSNILLERNNGGLGKTLITDFSQTKFPIVKSNTDIPSYASPEQIKGATPDERSDVYALGVILYELYTSTLPFQGKRPIAVIMQHVSAPPRPPDLVNPVISPALAQVILRCLAKNPQERFPTVSTLIVALANALHVTPPADLQRSALLDLASGANSTDTLSRPLSPLPQTSSLPPFPPKRKSRLGLATMIALVLLLGASLGTFVLLAQGGSPPTNQIIGHAFFLNSNQLNESSDQGLNDELQIDLSNIPTPDTGKSYYAWLLGDLSASEQIPLALGRLPVVHGNVHFVYTGDEQHTNLLSFASRFLITEDDAHNPTNDPLLNQSLWRYEATLPQTPDPTDALHFSMLDHLRHLLVESPEMQARGLNGGLAFWFSNNTAMVSNLSRSLLNDWQVKDTGLLRNQLIRILDYLDGSSYISADVPPKTPLLANAHDIQIALLGPTPNNTDPPGYVFQNEAPPGYVYLIETHVNGALLSPATTPEQHQIATTIAANIASIKQQLTQVWNDAKQLISLPKTQLFSQSSLTLLNDLTTQAQYAYTGQPNPATGNSQGGVLSVYTNLQRLATFDITPYVAPK